MRMSKDRILHVDMEVEDGKANVTTEWQGEIVRCKDCRWYEDPHRKIFENCVRNNRIIPMQPTDYCSYAERKEE